MIKTFIFGTPHGFDFYEKDFAYNEYLKGFYISSRKGSRLVVNRQSNGYTIYSYLRYELMEVKGRPNSFFGMSLLLDNNTYCSDFKKIFDWFEFLFGKILERNNLFNKNESGIIQYKIDRFKENQEEIDWIKSQLPNIFSSAADTPIDDYTNSFSWLKNGQVALHNNEDDNVDILADFKLYSTIAISSDFQKAIVLDYGEMADLLNDFNERLLRIIAGGKDAESYDGLSKLSNEFSDIKVLLDKYNENIKDKDEFDIFSDLGEKYASKGEQIEILVANYAEKPNSSISPILEPIGKKSSVECKIEKEFPDFNLQDDLVCSDCKKNEIAVVNMEKDKVCGKCGKRKPYTEFEKDENICIECALKRPQVNAFFKQLTVRNILIGACVILLLAVGVAVIFLFPKDSPLRPNENLRTEDSINDSVTSISTIPFDRETFNQYCTNGQFRKAYDYCSRCKDVDYKDTLRLKIEDKLLGIVKSTITLDKVLLAMDYLYTNHKMAMDSVNVDIPGWKVIAKKYDKIKKILKETQINDDDYKSGMSLIEAMPSRGMQDSLKNILSNKPKQSVAKKTKFPTSITIASQDSRGKNQSEERDVTSNIGIEYNIGQYVIIKYPEGASVNINGCPFELNSQAGWLRIHVDKSEQYTFYIGKIGITITGKLNTY